MATIIRRKSDNRITHCFTNLVDVNNISIDSEKMNFTLKNGAKSVISLSVNTNDYDRIDDVTAPTKFFGNMLTYIDGTWAIDTERLNAENTNRREIGMPEIEVEI